MLVDRHEHVQHLRHREAYEGRREQLALPKPAAHELRDERPHRRAREQPLRLGARIELQHLAHVCHDPFGDGGEARVRVWRLAERVKPTADESGEADEVLLQLRDVDHDSQADGQPLGRAESRERQLLERARHLSGAAMYQRRLPRLAQQIVEDSLGAPHRGQQRHMHRAQREEETLGDEMELRRCSVHGIRRRRTWRLGARSKGTARGVSRGVGARGGVAEQGELDSGGQLVRLVHLLIVHPEAVGARGGANLAPTCLSQRGLARQLVLRPRHGSPPPIAL
mmetsp:Transcript_40184/g.93784  ORF Transcript_40184/g.93784 Transcript_40184/m.93784 type:complete len:282 (-) Transcript_40184:1505-2350(-)